MTMDKKYCQKIQQIKKLAKTHPYFVKNTVAVFLLVVKVAVPHFYLWNERGLTVSITIYCNYYANSRALLYFWG